MASFRFLDHSQRCTTVGRTLLDERSARRSGLFLTTHNTYNRQTSMPSAGVETTASAGERPRIHALERAATGAGITKDSVIYYPERRERRNLRKLQSWYLDWGGGGGGVYQVDIKTVALKQCVELNTTYP
jgi:hypothetical protein